LIADVESIIIGNRCVADSGSANFYSMRVVIEELPEVAMPKTPQWRW